MDIEVLGLAELTRQLRELGDPKANANALRAATRAGMRVVMAQAQANIARISPGRAETHRTYKGRLVGAGFAARSLKMLVKMSPDKQKATAVLGVHKEAMYAAFFFELGTVYIPAQPWLRPALESQQAPAVAALAAVMQKRIEAIARKQARGK